MKEVLLHIKKLEVAMWESAKARDKKKFLELVSKGAVMICGGFRCLGEEYAQIISQFDLADYKIENYETVACARDFVQNHYIITTSVNNKKNSDLAGEFHVTSTWERKNSEWKLVFNMDSQIMM